MKYPYPCTHCSFCCLIAQCPVSLRIHGPRQPGEQCPALSFEGDRSSCALVKTLGPEIMGSGQGCCISAQIVIRGVAYDFASLPEDIKTLAVRNVQRAPGRVLDRRTLQPIA